MYTFNGKLNWSKTVVNQTITIVFPAGFALNDPVCAFWQWSEDASGNKKVNANELGFINTVTTKTGKYQVLAAFSHYSLDVTFASDSSTITATMSNPEDEHSDVATLNRVYGNLVQFRSTVVFTGKINWSNPPLENEMITLVIPNGISNGSPVGLYQATSSVTNGINKTFRNVTTSTNGEVKGTFDDGKGYTYEVNVRSGGTDVDLLVTSSNQASTTNELKKVYGYQSSHS
ncbi:hypothetical protein E1B28_003625 [Marasmius oreades]|uniref:Uncharacterized protein n=1 Tax=Marasmius oreades TaxID=181124 RepID=A0A9P7RLW5_9AGAR|nr:uncharacterized protein E1B28_003625 [Marasmius oreades]KAG7086111.1 hypothetical protein E1B28_003625 [Marasmius oreades]